MVLVQTDPVADDGRMQPFGPVEALFKERHFDVQIIVLCVSWYTSFKLYGHPIWKSQPTSPPTRVCTTARSLTARALAPRCSHLAKASLAFGSHHASAVRLSPGPPGGTSIHPRHLN